MSQADGVEDESAGEEMEDALNATLADSGGEDEDIEEWVSIPDNIQYLAYLLRFLSISHAFVAFAMMVAYYCLKVSI